MGRASVKQNKNAYQLARERMGLTREAACEKLGTVSGSRLERIENGSKKNIAPEDVVRMAECYEAPGLCNYYCTNECAIGRAYGQRIREEAGSALTLKLLSALNDLASDRDRLIAIMADGRIAKDEYPDFKAISEHLERMSLYIESLRVWTRGQKTEEQA